MHTPHAAPSENTPYPSAYRVDITSWDSTVKPFEAQLTDPISGNRALFHDFISTRAYLRSCFPEFQTVRGRFVEGKDQLLLVIEGTVLNATEHNAPCSLPTHQKQLVIGMPYDIVVFKRLKEALLEGWWRLDSKDRGAITMAGALARIAKRRLISPVVEKAVTQVREGYAPFQRRAPLERPAVVSPWSVQTQPKVALQTLSQEALTGNPPENIVVRPKPVTYKESPAMPQKKAQQLPLPAWMDETQGVLSEFRTWFDRRHVRTVLTSMSGITRSLFAFVARGSEVMMQRRGGFEGFVRSQKSLFVEKIKRLGVHRPGYREAVVSLWKTIQEIWHEAAESKEMHTVIQNSVKNTLAQTGVGEPFAAPKPQSAVAAPPRPQPQPRPQPVLPSTPSAPSLMQRLQGAWRWLTTPSQPKRSVAYPPLR